MSHLRNLGAALVLLALSGWIFPGWVPSVRAEEKPTISLIKTIEVRKFEDLKFSVDEYMVEQGDSLARLLTRRGIIKSGQLTERLVRLLKALNDGLLNPDLIVPGQKLILPTGPIEGLTPPPDPPPESGSKPGSEPKAVKAEPPEGKSYQTSADGTKYRVVKVNKGESLARLLRRQGVPEHRIFNEFIKLTLRLNPRISDPNLIYAAEELKIPFEAGWAEIAVARTGIKPRRPRTPPTGTRTRPRASIRPARPRVIVPPPPMPPSRHLATRTALGLIYTRVGERFIARGKHFLPLRSGGQITINTKSFPIIDLRNGQKIILDLDQRLPREMVDLIRANWTNYTIFTAKRNESLPAMLNRLFENSHYYKVRRRGRPWVFDRGLHVSVEADWIIWSTERDWRSGQAVVVTLPKGPGQGTSPELAAFLAENGVKVIDFHARGNMIGPEPRRGQPKKPVEVQELSPLNNTDFVKSILDLIGQKYETDLAIPLVKGSPGGGEFNLTVQAPLYFSRGNTNYVVAVDGLATDVRLLFEKHKFKVLDGRSGEGAASVARRLLALMGIKAEAGLTIKGSPQSSGGKIEVTMPGVMFKNRGQDLLLTPIPVPRTLAPLLNRPNLKVVRYRMMNQS